MKPRYLPFLVVVLFAVFALLATTAHAQIVEELLDKLNRVLPAERQQRLI